MTAGRQKSGIEASYRDDKSHAEATHDSEIKALYHTKSEATDGLTG